jgi:20S proteasome alpha/beta subunit
MTVCVAAICDNGKTIILVSDRMIGPGFIESEPNINKVIKLHDEWWLLFAGDDISPVFDIVDYAKEEIKKKQTKEKLAPDGRASLKTVMDAVGESYERKRIEQAESLYLKPIGWDIASFNGSAGGPNCLPDFGEIKAKIADYALNIELLVAGFSEGTAYVFSLVGREGAIINRHDLPGFYSIGSGGIGAIFMMYYRDLSYKTIAREAIYYAMEAKLFGEQASGVGEDTDLYIATADGKFISCGEQTTEGDLIKVWDKLRPRWIGKESRTILNSIVELKDFEKLKEERKPKTKKKKKPAPSSS